MPDFFLIFVANVWISQSDLRNIEHPKMPRISKRASLFAEYKLGNSAFSASLVMVPTFKKGHYANPCKAKVYFTTKLAKIRIQS